MVSCGKVTEEELVGEVVEDASCEVGGCGVLEESGVVEEGSVVTFDVRGVQGEYSAEDRAAGVQGEYSAEDRAAPAGEQES